MRSAITTAVLATAVFGQAMGARVHRHGHEHLHEKKAVEADKRGVGSVVTVEMDGKLVSWTNEYAGPAATSAAASVASAVSAASTTVAKAASAATSAAHKSHKNKGKSHKSSATASSSGSSSTGSSSSLTSAGTSRLNSLGVKVSNNPSYSDSTSVGLGSGGPFVVDFLNNADEDIVLVVWSAYDQASSWTAMGVCENTADITVSIPSGETTTVSFNPDAVSAKQLSGAFAPIYSDTVINNAGQVGNTWGEFTFTTQNVFSTTDVSRLIEPSGNNVSIQNYKSKGGDKTCLTDMDTCVFVCTDSASPCAYKIDSCPVGAAGNTASADGLDGGCAYEGTSGYSLVTFS